MQYQPHILAPVHKVIIIEHTMNLDSFCWNNNEEMMMNVQYENLH